MAYNAKKLAEEIDACLSRSPRTTLSQIAQDLGVSRRTISRLLGRCRGASYRSYQQSVLLKTALQLLRKGREPTIKETPYSLGYSSPAAFSRFIRSKTGKTPSEIRDGALMNVP
jgi:AraC-like DNA-binding protein